MITIYNIYGEYGIDLMLSKEVINGMFFRKFKHLPQREKLAVSNS